MFYIIILLIIQKLIIRERQRDRKRQRVIEIYRESEREKKREKWVGMYKNFVLIIFNNDKNYKFYLIIMQDNCIC